MDEDEDIKSSVPIWIPGMFYIRSFPFYPLNYFVDEEYQM